jgi:putative resolvase
VRRSAGLLADPKVTVVVVEHRDRLGRMNTELVESALSAHGRRLVVLDDERWPTTWCGTW